jgi:hypothetical protein
VVVPVVELVPVVEFVPVVGHDVSAGPSVVLEMPPLRAYARGSWMVKDAPAITTIAPRKIGRRLVLMDCPQPTPYTLTEKEFSQCQMCLDVLSASPGSFGAGATLAQILGALLVFFAVLVYHGVADCDPAIVTGAGAVLSPSDEGNARCKLRVHDATFRDCDGQRHAR